MAGTTVNDVIDGVPLILKSYHDAFSEYGINVPMMVLNEQRGRDKMTVIKELGGEKAPMIFEFFLNRLLENINQVKEIEGTEHVFKFLRERGIKIIVTTGFPKEVASGIIENLNWNRRDMIDGWVCSEMVGVSRPDPAMILYAMKTFDVTDPRKVIKVDDTAKGLEEGLNAGVISIGVLTGTQGVQRLTLAGPRTILKSIKELPDFLKKNHLI
jgi:phosphonatase-like hydrolase